MARARCDLDDVLDATDRNRRTQRRADDPLTTLTERVGAPTPNLTVARRNDRKMLTGRQVRDLTRRGHRHRPRRVLSRAIPKLTEEAITPARDLALRVRNAGVLATRRSLRHAC